MQINSFCSVFFPMFRNIVCNVKTKVFVRLEDVKYLYVHIVQCRGSGSKLDPYSGPLWIRIRITNTDTDTDR